MEDKLRDDHASVSSVAIYCFVMAGIYVLVDMLHSSDLTSGKVNFQSGRLVHLDHNQFHS